MNSDINYTTVEFPDIETAPVNLQNQSVLTEDGRVSLASIASAIIANSVFNAIRVKIKNSNEYCFIIFEKDEDGNISPTYLSEAEYAQLNQ